MKIKKNIYSLVFLLFLISGTLASCIRDPHPGYDMMDAVDETEVMLTVGIGSGSGEAADVKEGIKKMRVIVASVNGTEETVSYNNVLTDVTNTNALSYTINLTGIPKGQTRFYVVCNEYSLPQSAREYLAGLAVGTKMSGFSGYKVEDPNRESFPRLRVNVADTTGLPITGMSQIVDLQRKRESISFNIKYMVAKITVNVTNNTSPSKGYICVTSFETSEFLPDKAYLFPQDNGDVVPTDANHRSKLIDINAGYVEAGSKLERVMNLYVYPSSAGNGKYTLGMWCDPNCEKDQRLEDLTPRHYNPIPFFDGEALDRGVYAVLNGIFGDNPNPTFEYTVYDWESVSNDVPSFD